MRENAPALERAPLVGSDFQRTDLPFLSVFSRLTLPRSGLGSPTSKIPAMTPPLLRRVAPLLVALPALAMTASATFAQDVKKPETLTERISYAYGLMIARQLTERGIEVDLEQFNRAFKSVVEKAEPLLSEEEVAATFEENETAMEQQQRSAGEAFLAENAKKEGVKTTESGLQYEVLKAGDGPKPKATDEVTVHYHGTLIDGKVFDSSVERGEPTSFPLNRVIPGWTEGVQLMPLGSKYRFCIPSDLAYGERGAGEDIKPHSTLIFEVELLKINGQ